MSTVESRLLKREPDGTVATHYLAPEDTVQHHRMVQLGTQKTLLPQNSARRDDASAVIPFPPGSLKRHEARKWGRSLDAAITERSLTPAVHA